MTQSSGGENREGYPQDPEREVVAAGGRAALGVIPHVGAWLGELWAFVVMALLRRRDKWGPGHATIRVQ